MLEHLCLIELLSFVGIYLLSNFIQKAFWKWSWKKKKETPAEPPLSPLGPVSSPAQQAHARLILLPSLRLWLTPGPRPTHPLTPGAHMAAPSPSSRVTEKDFLLPRPTQSRNPRDIPCLMRQPSAIKRPPQSCSFFFASPHGLATLAAVFFQGRDLAESSELANPLCSFPGRATTPDVFAVSPSFA